MKILNLGAGNRIIEAADNHDIVKHRSEINIVFDLDKITDWVMAIACDLDISINDTFERYDRVEFISVIEHLQITPIEALNRCWYLLKPNGVLVVKYPHYTSSTMATDPTHRWRLNEESLEYVDPNTKHGQDCNYYTDKKWNILTPRENRMVVRGGNRTNVKLEMRPIK